MQSVLSLVGRNNKLYYRDRSAVFFSVLSGVIIVGLYLFFLRDLYTSNMVENGLSQLNAEIFIFTWLLCGVIGLNTFTVPAALISTFIYDRESNVLKDFLVSPVSLFKIMSSYIISGIIMSTLVNIILLVILIGYQNYHNVLQINYSDIITLCFVYLLSSITFTTISFCIAVFIKSSNAFSGFTSLCSAFLGFLSGIYVPIGDFDGMVRNAISIFPITQYIAVLKKVFLLPFIETKFVDAPEELHTFLNDFFGVVLKYNDFEITTGLTMILLIVILFVSLTISLTSLKKINIT